MILPDSVVRHVESGNPGEARIAVNKIGGTIDAPTLCILANAYGSIGLMQILTHAVETAPTPDDKAAWKGLSQQITAAIISAIGPVE